MNGDHWSDHLYQFDPTSLCSGDTETQLGVFDLLILDACGLFYGSVLYTPNRPFFPYAEIYCDLGFHGYATSGLVFNSGCCGHLSILMSSLPHRLEIALVCWSIIQKVFAGMVESRTPYFDNLWYIQRSAFFHFDITVPCESIRPTLNFDIIFCVDRWEKKRHSIDSILVPLCKTTTFRKGQGLWILFEDDETLIYSILIQPPESIHVRLTVGRYYSCESFWVSL